MKRFYYICDDLDELEEIETELEANGVVTPQIHVLSKDDAGVTRHRKLNEVHPFMKQDIVNSTLKGALLGVVASVTVVALGWAMGIPAAVGWTPMVFLGVVVLGFCTWEGGLWGIQQPNRNFEQFKDELERGNHILMIDADSEHEALLDRILAKHPKVQSSGTGKAAPRWIIGGQQKAREFVEWAP